MLILCERQIRQQMLIQVESYRGSQIAPLIVILACPLEPPIPNGAGQCMQAKVNSRPARPQTLDPHVVLVGARLIATTSVATLHQVCVQAVTLNLGHDNWLTAFGLTTDAIEVEVRVNYET